MITGETADRDNMEIITGNRLENQDVSQQIADAVNIGQTQTLSVAYVGGFIIKKFLEQTNCAACSKNLLGSSDAPHNLFISFKEWSDVTEKLIYPAEHPVVTVGYAITLLEEFLEKNCTSSNLSQAIENHLNLNVNFSWISCIEHTNLIKNAIIRGIWKIGIPWWCKRKMREHREQKQHTHAEKLQKFEHS